MTSHPFTLSLYLGTLTDGLGCFPFDYEAYPPHSHCRSSHTAIRSLIGFGNLVRPLAHSVLYLRHETSDAAPKCISGRTSYIRVRLVFHPYPQLIQAVFNRQWSGPPRGLTPASPWPWVDHAVSGLLCMTIRPVRTRFPCGSIAERLNLATQNNSSARSAKSTPSPINGIRLLVSARFQVLFHSPPGVLFTVPSRYYALSVVMSI